MLEPVRLVIWDLDETFWNGTLTEGGVTMREDTRSIVIELAGRGIMSSICSKNDFETVKAVLVEAGIWDYFIFPSINWEPKGVRIASLIDAVQLRPPTVLFIDDNPMNLNEARHYCPDVQTADEKFIPEILGHALFKGKPDSGLSRLQQYKLLEKRKLDEMSAGGDNTEFLRSSNIRVTIDHDIEANLDRVIELINRTNQLNFTKRRLSENINEARKELLAEVSDYRKQCGVVKVRDNYGDYGIVGFYAVSGGVSRSRLLHFCFSCRILNMGVETWLYNNLSRPRLTIVGDVLTQVARDDRDIDWITLVNDAAMTGSPRENSDNGVVTFDRVLLRGGCELRAVSHYLNLNTTNLVEELNDVRDGVSYRIDHSLVFRYAVEGLPLGALELCRTLGYLESDFESAFNDGTVDNMLCVISFWLEGYQVYRHKETGFLIPYQFGELSRKYQDLSQLPIEEIERESFTLGLRKALTCLNDEFERVGPLSLEEIEENVKAVLRHKNPTARVVILLENDRPGEQWGVSGRPPRSIIEKNKMLTRVAEQYNNVMIVRIADCLTEEPAAKEGVRHFDRMVYFRAYQRIIETAQSPNSLIAAAE